MKYKTFLLIDASDVKDLTMFSGTSIGTSALWTQKSSTEREKVTRFLWECG